MAARARGGSVTGYAVGLVIFVILFVISLVTAILFYTQVSAAKQEAQAAQARVEQLLKPAEANRPDIQRLVGDIQATKQSVVGSLYDQNQKLKTLVTGDAGAPVETIESTLAAADVGVTAGRTAVGVIKNVRAELADARQQTQQTADQLAEARRKLDAAGDERKAAETQFDVARKKLEDQLKTLQQQQVTYSTTVSTEQKKVEDRLMQLQAEYTTSKGQAAELERTLRQQIAILEGRIEQLINIQKGPGQDVDPTLFPDGKIVAFAGDPTLIYINRGRNDHMTLGLTFAVYDANAKIEKDRFEELRGKGTIEVIQVLESTSLGRVVRLERGRTINEGDLIANVVYDSNVVYKFFIFGDFDIDNSGQPTNADRKRIETMVSDWGAKVAENLTYDTDFLVLGIEPKMPEPLAAGESRPDVIEAHAAAERKYQQYQMLIAEAQKYRIPVLNQNRFLALVGYYQR